MATLHLTDTPIPYQDFFPKTATEFQNLLSTFDQSLSFQKKANVTIAGIGIALLSTVGLATINRLSGIASNILEHCTSSEVEEIHAIPFTPIDCNEDTGRFVAFCLTSVALALPLIAIINKNCRNLIKAHTAQTEHACKPFIELIFNESLTVMKTQEAFINTLKKHITLKHTERVDTSKITPQFQRYLAAIHATRKIANGFKKGYVKEHDATPLPRGSQHNKNLQDFWQALCHHPLIDTMIKDFQCKLPTAKNTMTQTIARLAREAGLIYTPVSAPVPVPPPQATVSRPLAVRPSSDPRSVTARARAAAREVLAKKNAKAAARKHRAHSTTTAQ